MNQLTRRVVLGAAIVGAGVVGKTKVAASNNPPAIDGSSPTPSPTPVVPDAPIGFIAWTAAGESGLPLAGTTAGEPIATAHFKLAIDGFASVTELTQDDVDRLEGELEPMKAPAGYHFVVAQITAADPYWEDDPAAKFALSVGGKLTPRATPFGAYRGGSYENPTIGVVALAKLKEPVSISLNDVGRLAGYDLLTGKRGRDANTMSFDPFLTPAQVAVDRASVNWSRAIQTDEPGYEVLKGNLILAVDPDVSTALVPWSKAQGWAPNKHVWCIIGLTPRPVPDVASKLLNPDGTIDFTKSYRLTAKGGKPAVGKSTLPSAKVLGYGHRVEVAWPVSTTATNATLVADFVISGVTKVFTNLTAKCKFTAASKPAVFAVTFSR